MKTTFSAFILATFLAACTSNTRNEAKNTARQNIRPIKSERPFIDINKFKVRRLRFFDIEKWGYEETNANLIKLSKNEVKQFFHFYFNIQENTS